MKQPVLSIEMRLFWLRRYMELYIDQWPVNNLTFDIWLARMFGNGKLSPADPMVNRSRMKSRCYYCHRKFSEENGKTKDHVIAKALGGNNSKDNLVNCCQDCNLWKGCKTLYEWIKGVKRAHKKVRLGKNRKPYELRDLELMISNISNKIKFVENNYNNLVWKK